MKPLRIVAGGVALAQAVFFAEYYRLSNGCFCATLTNQPQKRLLWPSEVTFLEVAAFPARHLPFSLPASIGDAPQALLLTLVSALVWFALLAGLYRLMRLVWSRNAETRLTATPRI